MTESEERRTEDRDGGNNSGPRPPALRPKDGHLEVSSMRMYSETRSALAERRFGHMDGSDYPVAQLRSRGKVVGHAVMRPPATDEGYVDPDWLVEGVQEMWRLRDGLSDLDADVLDAMTAAWISQGPTDDRSLARISVDRILEARGIRPKAGGSGRRGGYGPEQRQEIIDAIGRVQSVAVEMEMDWPENVPAGKKPRMSRRRVHSRLVVITDAVIAEQLRLDGLARYDGFSFRVGEAVETFLSLPAGRQAALLSLTALRYDPYRQIAEKRLARGLSERWRVGASREGQYRRPYRVADLVRTAGMEEFAPSRPQRRKERLEKALDTLEADKVIAAWEYEESTFVDPMSRPRQGWEDLWLGSTILIEPPDIVKDFCDAIADRKNTIDKKKTRGLPPREKTDIGTRLKAWREKRKLSQRAATDRLNVLSGGASISQGYLSLIERGKKEPATELRARIETLISGTHSVSAGNPRGEI
ncbi:MAG: XRE family transcriptional regulator [Actinomycetota bacterium]|nr:XRE family transcriptional regulator [Actinomycetota bacterium]